MTAEPVSFSVVIPATERLDRFLADQLGISRTQSARLVAEAASPSTAKLRAHPGHLRAAKSWRSWRPMPSRRANSFPTDIPLVVVYEDEHIAVIDKPAGLVVHPAPGHWDDTLVNALVARGTTLAGGAEGRPGIVHRLDRETSGLILVAKSEVAHRKLGAMIAARRIARVYAALVWGHLDESPLRIEAPIGRDLRDRKRMAILSEGRRGPHGRVRDRPAGSMDLTRLELHTGRTHQIRVHLESIGHPIVGDPVYAAGGWKRITGQYPRPGPRAGGARAAAGAPRSILAFRHPMTGDPMRLDVAMAHRPLAAARQRGGQRRAGRARAALQTGVLRARRLTGRLASAGWWFEIAGDGALHPGWSSPSRWSEKPVSSGFPGRAPRSAE